MQICPRPPVARSLCRRNDVRIAVIMSGGSGRRFWPLSRECRPKQVVPLVGGKSLLELAIRRLLPVFPAGRIWIVTQDSQVEATTRIAKRFKGLRVISEPEGKNTAACVTYAATVARRTVGDASIAFLPADHFVRNARAFGAALSAGLDFVERRDVILTMGIKPSRPATGFGYIRRGALVGKAGRFRFYSVERFTEKPSARTAGAYVRSGAYSWNAGIFMTRASVLLEEVACHLPETSRGFVGLEKRIGTNRERTAKARCYSLLPEISLDFGVMEKTSRACVMPVDIGWDDVGNWDSFAKLMKRDASGNSVSGHHLGIDTSDCVIFAGGSPVATVGVKNLVVVAVGDAVLVAGREHAEKVKDLSRLLASKGFDDLL